MKKLLSNPPCEKCIYKLGIIKTIINPCIMCKLNGYKTYKQYVEDLHKGIKHK